MISTPNFKFVRRGRAAIFAHRCRATAGMTKRMEIHYKLKDGLQFILFDYGKILARVTRTLGPWDRLLDAIVQVPPSVPAACSLLRRSLLQPAPPRAFPGGGL